MEYLSRGRISSHRPDEVEGDTLSRGTSPGSAMKTGPTGQTGQNGQMVAGQTVAGQTVLPRATSYQSVRSMKRQGSTRCDALHPAPCTLHPAPCTLHPTPCTLHSYTLHPEPYTLHPEPYTPHHTP